MIFHLFSVLFHSCNPIAVNTYTLEKAAFSTNAHLDQNGYRQECDHPGLLENFLTLEREEQYEGGEQGTDRPGADGAHRRFKGRLTAL